MLKFISDIFSSLFHRNGTTNSADSEEVNIAIAELLFHVALSDNMISDDERDMIYHIAEDKLGVPILFLEQHLNKMNEGIDQEVDLIHISNVLNKSLTQDQRDELIRTLTSLTYSDNQLDGTEDYRVWEIAQLLGVETLRPLTG